MSVANPLRQATGSRGENSVKAIRGVASNQLANAATAASYFPA